MRRSLLVSCVALTIAVALSRLVLPDSQGDTSGREPIRRGAGGNFTDLGYGTHGFVIAGYEKNANRSSLRRTAKSAGYYVDFPVHQYWEWSAVDSRHLRIPGSENRSPACWFADSPSQLTLTVKVPWCADVTFYFIDPESYHGRRGLMVHQDGAVVAVLSVADGYVEGAYVTVHQTSPKATYTITTLSGRNAPLQAVFFDPSSEEACALDGVFSTSNPPETPAPPRVLPRLALCGCLVAFAIGAAFLVHRLLFPFVLSSSPPATDTNVLPIGAALTNNLMHSASRAPLPPPAVARLKELVAELVRLGMPFSCAPGTPAARSLATIRSACTALGDRLPEPVMAELVAVCSGASTPVARVIADLLRGVVVAVGGSSQFAERCEDLVQARKNLIADWTSWQPAGVRPAVDRFNSHVAACFKQGNIGRVFATQALALSNAADAAVDSSTVPGRLVLSRYPDALDVAATKINEALAAVADDVESVLSATAIDPADTRTPERLFGIAAGRLAAAIESEMGSLTAALTGDALVEVCADRRALILERIAQTCSE